MLIRMVQSNVHSYCLIYSPFGEVYLVCVGLYMLQLSSSRTVLQIYSSTALQLYSSTTLQLYSSTTLQRYSSRALQLYNATALQLYSSSTALQLQGLCNLSFWALWVVVGTLLCRSCFHCEWQDRIYNTIEYNRQIMNLL